MSLLELLGFASAVIMGLILGLTGGGGSILTVPILFYFFGQNAVTATTESLLIVGVTSMIGAGLKARQGLIDIKTSLVFAVPSFVGVFFSRRILLPLLSEKWSIGSFTITQAQLILSCFALLMIAASLTMIRSGIRSLRPTPERLQPSMMNVIIKGFVVGSVTGFVGSGGGFLIVPSLVLLLGMPMRIAIGSSMAILSANSLFGFMISPPSGYHNWQVTMGIIILGLIGLLTGHFISHKFDERKLKMSFGFFVLIAGSLVLLHQSLQILLD